MLHIGVHYIDFFTEGQCLAVRWNRGDKETMYVDSVLHIGVHYIDAEGSVFSCEGEQGRECERFSRCCCLTCV